MCYINSCLKDAVMLCRVRRLHCALTEGRQTLMLFSM